MATWNTWTEEKVGHITDQIRAKRVRTFCELLGLGPTAKVLDLGSEDGSYLAQHYPYPKNIWLAYIDPDAMQLGQKKWGLGGTILISEDGTLPLEDKSFSAVFCNSVIEHVTIDKAKIGKVTNSEFQIVSECRVHR